MVRQQLLPSTSQGRAGGSSAAATFHAMPGEEAHNPGVTSHCIPEVHGSLSCGASTKPPDWQKPVFQASPRPCRHRMGSS